jgi:hypothetical protein
MISVEDWKDRRTSDIIDELVLLGECQKLGEEEQSKEKKDRLQDITPGMMRKLQEDIQAIRTIVQQRARQ